MYQVMQSRKTNTYFITDLFNMQTQELLNIFSQFTREDWNKFDKIKSLAFQPTQEELEEQARQQEEYRQSVITSKLQAIWIERPKTVTKEFVLYLLQWINAQQFVWDNLEEWIESQVILFWDIETAFNELVIRYL